MPEFAYRSRQYDFERSTPTKAEREAAAAALARLADKPIRRILITTQEPRKAHDSLRYNHG